MEQLLRDFAHAIAPGPTRALTDGGTGALTVFVLGGPPEAGTVVVARCGREFRVGPIAFPAPGWVEIGATAYPAARVEVRGPVLFVARSVPEEVPS
jgi:hypothetical protein